MGTNKFKIPQSSEVNFQKSQFAPQIEVSQNSRNPTKLSKNDDEPPEPPLARVTFEEILESLGCFGPFQVLTLCSYLFLEIACSFVAFIPIFVGRSTLPKNCTEISENITLPSVSSEDIGDYSTTTEVYQTSVDSLAIRGIFDGFLEIFESPFKYESIADEWDLKCDRAWIPDLFTSCLMAGMILGNIVVSQMADWYGRRRTYLAVLVIMATGTVMSSLSPSIYVYALSRVVSGAAFSGHINVSTMAVMEFMTAKWRSVANCAGPLGEGIMLLSLLGYFIRPWRMLYIATLAPYLLIIPIFMYLPEGPRWLLRNNRVKEAHEILGYMAKVNGRKPVSLEVLEALRKQEELATASQKNKRIGYIDFIRNRDLLVPALYLFAIWFSWNVAYYGISYNIRNVPGDPYLNLAQIGLANAIGQRLSFIICDWVGRRKAVLMSMSFSASFLVTLAICFLTMEHVSTYLILAGCFFGLLGLSSCRACARLLSGESFPTAVRTMGLAVGGLGANLSGLVTPQLAFLGSKWPHLPFFVFATVAVAGSLIVFMMKETNGNPLSDNVQIGDKKKKAGAGEV